MNAGVLTALQDAIKKWRQIERGEMLDMGPENCPLCWEFYASGCEGCPVMEQSGYSGCRNTPYDNEWVGVATSVTLPTDHGAAYCTRVMYAGSTAAVHAARAERKFLESLLPKERSKS